MDSNPTRQATRRKITALGYFLGISLSPKGLPVNNQFANPGNRGQFNSYVRDHNTIYSRAHKITIKISVELLFHILTVTRGSIRVHCFYFYSCPEKFTNGNWCYPVCSTGICTNYCSLWRIVQKRAV